MYLHEHASVFVKPYKMQLYGEYNLLLTRRNMIH